MAQYPAVINLSSLNGANGFQIDGAAAGDYLGFSVSSAGDVNGDGFADLIVGAYGDTASQAGAAYVIFGRAGGFASTFAPSSLNGANGFKMAGPTSAYAGVAVSSAGDVNGDGFDDVIVGASPIYGMRAGAAYVVFGKASGFDATLALASLNGANGFKLAGAAGDTAGRSVSSAGDINGDGLDDLIVGAPYSGGSCAGASYVVFGQRSFSAQMNLSALNGTNGFKVTTTTAGSVIGHAVSSAGDVNGDGFDDLIIGGPGGPGSGASYVVFGKATGFAATLAVESLNGANGFKLAGVNSSDYNGGSVSSAGDVNGDGFDDLIVGASAADPYGRSGSGASYVVFGHAGAFAPTLNLSGLNGTNGFAITGVAANDGSGVSVSDAGDVNGDGFADLIIGARRADGNFGAAYVVFGRTSGFAAIVNLGTLDGANGFKIAGETASTSTGFSVSGAGDINNDGFDDLIVGAPSSNSNGASAGAAYVVFGRAPDTAVTRTGSSASQKLAGGAFADTLNGLGGDDRLYGNGGNDKLDGGAGVDTAVFSGNRSDYVITPNPGAESNTFKVRDTRAGAPNGTDTLTNVERLQFADTTVDLTLFPATVALASLDGKTGFRLYGIAGGDQLGISVSDAGDVNGDGFADVIVGANQRDIPGVNAGAAYIVFGKAGAFGSGAGAGISVGGLNGSNGFILSGEASVDYAGTSVSAAGDINGDGFDDVIVGAPDNASSKGASYVVFGKASGFADSLSLSTLDGTNGFKIVGDAAGGDSGRSVSSAGDVNGDGFDDLIIGAPYADSNGNGAGAAYVVFGKASGFTSTFSLSSLNGANGFKVVGSTTYDSAGLTVSKAGDINGDGFDDILVSANGAASGGAYSGAVYVVFGKANGFAASIAPSSLNGTNGFRIQGADSFGYNSQATSDAGDVNGDGFDDLLVRTRANDRTYVVFGKASGFGASLSLSSLDGTNGFRISGGSPGAGYSLSSAGDVNGDGFDDIIIGNGISGAGAAYVVFGKAGGFASDLSLADIDGTNGFKLTGTGAQDLAGYSASSAGDLNNDGFDDLIVGAPLAASGAGASYVIYGRAPTTAVTRNGTAADQTLAGGAFADTLNGGGGDDILYGGGGADVMRGDSGNDTFYVDNIGDRVIEGANAGIDTVHTTVSFSLAGQQAERLFLDGTAAKGTGNGFANTITSNGGANTIDGGGGADTMIGGGGNDIYYVDNAGDKVIEAFGGGIDTVYSKVTFSLVGQQADRITLEGTAAVNATGNELANIIVGNAAANKMTGNAGNDRLTGGDGADTFIFKAGWGKDTITDFAAGDGGADRVQIDKTLFANYADLMAHTIDGGSGAIIRYDAANTITLTDVTKAQLTSGDFSFV